MHGRPLIAQFPLAARETSRAELEEVATPKSGSPRFFVRAGEDDRLGALAIVNVRETSGAGLKFRPPGCDAVTVHEPPLVIKRPRR